MYEFIPTDAAREKYELQETRFTGRELLTLFKTALPELWQQGNRAISNPPLLGDRILLSNPVLPNEFNGVNDDSVARVYAAPTREEQPLFIGFLQLAL